MSYDDVSYRPNVQNRNMFKIIAADIHNKSPFSSEHIRGYSKWFLFWRFVGGGDLCCCGPPPPPPPSPVGLVIHADKTDGKTIELKKMNEKMKKKKRGGGGEGDVMHGNEPHFWHNFFSPNF